MPITAGTGTLVDSRTIGSEHRQVVCIGDESAATVAEVAGNALAVRPMRSTTGTISSVAASVTSVTLLASNTSRLKATFFNDSVNTLYLALASTASSTSFTVKMGPDAYFELPNDVLYTAIVTGIWTATGGSCRATELT